MKEKNELDILIPVFNENETIVKTIQNILSAVQCNYRILICYDYDEDPTLNIINEYLVAIKGPLTTPIGGGIRSINVALRQKLDLYVCLRPIKYFEKVHVLMTTMRILFQNCLHLVGSR